MDRKPPSIQNRSNKPPIITDNATYPDAITSTQTSHSTGPGRSSNNNANNSVCKIGRFTEHPSKREDHYDIGINYHNSDSEISSNEKSALSMGEEAVGRVIHNAAVHRRHCPTCPRHATFN
ncbi:hypothetical protein WA026_009379 [Henosepilachna vigintioctopunctata]|uniref:Uncharacterized protein n=1 Tax=Henosepilachna vigintioctopunctata TaxID=420089 RepID=A0AAW1TVI4_9CUCU